MFKLKVFSAPELLTKPLEMLTALPETVYPPPVKVIEWTDRPVMLFWGLSAPPVTAGSMMSSPVVGTEPSFQLAGVFQL